jgi:hypothetical protein
MPPSPPPGLQNLASRIGDPLLISISDARIISGLSRSEIYRRMAAGDIRAVKGGTRTLIVLQSLVEHLKALPPAKLREPS